MDQGSLVTRTGGLSQTFWLPAQTTTFTPPFPTSLVPLCPYAETDDPESCTAVYYVSDFEGIQVQLSQNWPQGYADLFTGT